MEFRDDTLEADILATLTYSSIFLPSTLDLASATTQASRLFDILAHSARHSQFKVVVGGNILLNHSSAVDELIRRFLSCFLGFKTEATAFEES